MPDPRIKGVEEIVAKIATMFAGTPPEVVGAVLADLLARFIAGHAPDIREEVLALHIEFMRPLIEVNEKIAFGDAGHPGRQWSTSNET